MSDQEDRGTRRERDADFAPKGCCTIVFDGGTQQHRNVSERRCEELAEEVGGMPMWKEGPCP